ncbi:tRNA (uracil(54)-C(5))-methyltransferase [uncultured archaeon]|nr:tRNA (uracil(54)-C(5))-methyltransferase [uncultured archaeon]
MNNNRVKEYFEDIASDFDSYYEKPNGFFDKVINDWLRRPGLIKRMKISLELSSPISGKRVLDVGCGSGKFVVECAKNGAKVVGIDISKEMIKIAKDFCKKNNVEAELRIGDSTQDLPNGFDVCVALGVFEYFKDPKPILNKMFTSTRTGGKVIFSVPSLFAFQTPFREILLHYRDVKCYYYTEKNVLTLLDGFKADIKKFEFYNYGPGMVVCIEK